MNTTTQTTRRRNVSYSLFIVAVAICVVMVIALLLPRGWELAIESLKSDLSVWWHTP